MLRSLTLPDGNVVRPGTILGDVLQYNAARHTMASKFAKAGDSATLESSTSAGKTITSDDNGDLDLKPKMHVQMLTSHGRVRFVRSR